MKLLSKQNLNHNVFDKTVQYENTLSWCEFKCVKITAQVLIDYTIAGKLSRKVFKILLLLKIAFCW